jgi:hypothetical protein
MKSKTEKHMPYFTVLEAFKKAKGCAFCELEADAAHRRLDSLLYESVNDPGVRDDLLRSRGYCPRHAHLLLGFGDGLGTAILYRDQVRLFLEFLGGIRKEKARLLKDRPSARWQRHAFCPACRLQFEEREFHIDILLQGLDDADLRAAFESSPGLCVPHFFLVLEKARGEARCRYLAEMQEKRFGLLLADLDEFYRKSDYQARKEGFGQERDSWVRAVKMLTGSRDVF